ncbi:putative phosphoenolpyruvate synthase [Argiope bruennichi]|uniref:putative phosphoenolpyruvate synthase n=1 Tax=Argiope bruennichi TaxID=94029 RepID=UPI0024944DB4|nr:putative phosphoenolpyruvate synthase [Argiope bruennichi]
MCNIIYWFKWIISHFYIKIFRRSIKRRFDSFEVDSRGDPYKSDFLPHPDEKILESPLPESQLLNTADEVFFYGVNSKSEYLITRIVRGVNQEAQAWIYLKLNNGKIYRLQETSGFQQTGRDKKIFSCGGLQIHYLLPMRRWRIFFNGVLNEINEDGTLSNKKVHVKFALIWTASTDPFDFRTDVNSKALTSCIAKAKWNQYKPPLQKLFSALDFYAQCGVIMGTISIDGNDEQNLYLFGERIRFMGDLSSSKGMEFVHVLGHISRNGRFVHVVEVSIENVVEKLIFGFSTSLTGCVRLIQDNNCRLEMLIDEERNEKDIEAKFHARDKPYHLKGRIPARQHNIKNTVGWNGQLSIDCLDFELDLLKRKNIKHSESKESNSLTGGQIGKGIVINGKMLKPSRKNNANKSSLTSESGENTMDSSYIPFASQVIPCILVTHFSEKTCQDPEITGGKGSSLGKLTELSNELQGKFVVPKGVVVTTSAYQLFVTDHILEEVKNLENVLHQDKAEETKAACQRLMDEVIKTKIPDEIRQSFVMNFMNAFPERKHDDKFAVRSSATGEDTEQMSAAGQMESYLGIAGISEIMAAIKKCWASQFSYIAVQYKRQNGQMINSPMAVVVQQMIPCDVAGVLFTCDPLTGSPTTMSITANYGLGESVVSGSEEPDTIEIERLDENNLIIKNKIIGSKGHKIILKDDGGTDIEDVPEYEKQSCCLSDNMALFLGQIAIKIEKTFGSYRDIEWGFWNNNLYIFQSRPVTSGTGETNFEIDHEFDAPLRCEDEYFAMCNVGEVLPGATSPLGLDLTLKYFKTVLQSKRYSSWGSLDVSRYFPKGIVSMYRHVMFTGIDLFPQAYESPTQAEISGVALFGRIIDDDDLYELAKERFSDEPVKLFTNGLYIKLFYRMIYGAKAKLKRLYKNYRGYTLSSTKFNNSQELFDHLISCCTGMSTPMGTHIVCSEASCCLNLIIFNILQKAVGEINTDVYSDFSQLVTTSSGVESADVPAAMERLAYFILKEKSPEDFKSMKTEAIILTFYIFMNFQEALRWLETSSTTAGERYRDFLIKHGHRCFREMDIHSLTWKTDPQSLVKLLQNLVGNITEDKVEKKEEDFEKLISGLKSPMTSSSKFALRMFLPLCRKAVKNREWSKSIIMRVLNEWRKGYRRLAKLMVQEGRIPDEDLLFFMNLEEIKELLETRSPKIISKAIHRRRRQPIIDKYIFPEINKGFPVPINAEKKIEVNTDDNFSMKGIPVSQGITTGVVRVALDLEEASLLKPGEILLTYSTDIGWSPYFPFLGGVVTELGGLISHGAVVSREYGLPCIAGLHGATQLFKTGDYVVLDGNKGILQRLPKSADS